MANYPYYGNYNQFYQPPLQDNLAQMRNNQYMQMPQMPQMQPMQFMQQMQNQQSGNGIIWVQGEEGAKAYIVAPGNSALLMDSENNSFYIKSSDNSGMPMPLRIFDYFERNAKQQTQNIKPNVEYVTRQEFDALSARINDIMANINNNSESVGESNA